MSKKIFWIMIISVSILIIGCTKEVTLIESKEENYITYSNENINIKISDGIEETKEIYKKILTDIKKTSKFSQIDNLEIEIDNKYSTPSLEGEIKCNSVYIETEDFKKELIKKSYGIYDNWIIEGLYAKIYNIENGQIDFSAYYKDNEFSLFGARFFEPFSPKEEVESIKSASVDLVEYLLKNNKKEELLKNEIYIEDIEKWAKDEDIDLTYQRGIESLMNRMDVSNARTDRYLSIDTKEEIRGYKVDVITIYEQWDTSKKIEDFLLNIDKNTKAIREGIKKDAPNFYKEYGFVIEDVSKTYYFLNSNMQFNHPFGGGQVAISSLWAHIHEYLHRLTLEGFRDKGVSIHGIMWLNEGVVNYLDVAYTDSAVFIIEDFLQSIRSVANEEGVDEETKEFFDIVFTLLKENNIEIDNLQETITSKEEKIKLTTLIEAFNIKFAEYMTPKGLPTSIVPGGKSGDGKLPLARGNHENYFLNRSFTNYLVQEYGLEKILYLMLEEFSTVTYEEYFGKTYEELKEEWMNYLKENIKASELII